MSIDLKAFTVALVRWRDDHQRLVEEFGDERDRGYANGYRSALALLHIHTGGEFGASLGEQTPGGAA